MRGLNEDDLKRIHDEDCEVRAYLGDGLYLAKCPDFIVNDFKDKQMMACGEPDWYMNLLRENAIKNALLRADKEKQMKDEMRKFLKEEYGLEPKTKENSKHCYITLEDGEGNSYIDEFHIKEAFYENFESDLMGLIGRYKLKD